MTARSRRAPRRASHRVSRRSRRTSGRLVPHRACLAAVLLAAVALSGCSDTTSQETPTTTTEGAAGPAVDPDLQRRLPADISASGVLRIVTDASYPPLESFAPDGRTIVGVDADLANAIAAVLGVEASMINGDFGDLIDIVAGGEADLVMSAMTDTVERQERLDFVDYFLAGSSIVTRKGNPHAIGTMDSLCGHTVAVEAATIQESQVADFQSQCSAPIEVVSGVTNDDALVLLRTDRAVAVLMDFPSAEYLVTNAATAGFYELATTEQFDPGRYGIGVAKDHSELRDLVADVLRKLHADGVYDDILAAWNVSDGALPEISINGASG